MIFKKSHDIEEQLLSDDSKIYDERYYCSSVKLGKKFYLLAACMMMIIGLVGDELIQRLDRYNIKINISETKTHN